MMELMIMLGAIALALWGVGEMLTRGRRVASWWKLGSEALERGDVKGAAQALARVVRLAPASSTGRRLYARALAEQKEYAKAEEQLRFAAALEPRNAEGHLDLALFLLACRPSKSDDAVESLATALEHAPGLSVMLRGLPIIAPLLEHPRLRGLLGHVPS